MSAANRAARIEILERVPLFSVFEPGALEALAGLFTEVSFRKGETVCREGDPGERFYVVVSGELAVWGGNGGQQITRRLGPGDFLGEISLLLGSPRTATVTCSRSSRLLALEEADFRRELLNDARVLEYMSRVLCRHLMTANRDRPARRKLTTVGVTGEPRLRGKTMISSALALFLRELANREVLLVSVRLVGEARTATRREPLLEEISREPADRLLAAVDRDRSGPARLTVRVDPSKGESHYTLSLTALVEKLADAFPLLVIDLGSEPSALMQAAREISDFHVELVDRCASGVRLDEAPDKRTLRVVNLHNASSAPVEISHCEPFVIPEDPALAKIGPVAQARHLQQNPRSPASPPLRRLARKILGATVGIAVGGGAAFGVSHVGVLQVLEENGIPIDLLAGTSMGSIVALSYASGISPQEMVEIADRIGTRRMTLSALDVTLTKPGLLAGNRLIEIFAPLLKARDFADLVFPCRTIATDIESGETIAVSSGLLAPAFRASCSVPVLWAPIRHQGHTLVDGAMTSPVPVDAVRDMGADVCIAVNVVPSLKKGVDTVLSRLYRRLNRFNPLALLGGSRDLPNMFDITMNSIQQLQHELGNFKAISADVRIHPDLSEFTWIEFYRPRELIERGARATERALPEIRRVLAEKLVLA